MKRIGLLAFTIILVALSLIVHAQEGGEVTLLEGYQITLLGDWEIDEGKDGVYTLANGDLQIVLTLPEVVAEEVELTEQMDAADVLIAALPEQELEPRDVVLQSIESRVMASTEYETESDQTKTQATVTEVAPGEFALMVFTAPATDYRDAEADALRIMLSLEAQPAPLTGAPVELCVARATGPYKPLRLGPGYNRGEFASMPEGEDVLVVGQNTAEDGSRWWQVDIDGPSAKLWVADTDVELTDHCETVSQTDTTPVPPTPPVAPNATTEGSESEPGGTVTTDTSKIPKNGTWAMSMAAEIALSCEGTGTVREPNTLRFKENSARITVSSDGTQLTMTYSFGPVLFSGGNGYYQAEATEGDLYLVYRLRVHDSTSMSGEVALAVIGLPCSGTVPVSLTYLGG